MPPKSRINFRPEQFQQAAPAEYYRAPEKLLYRFICSHLVFACPTYNAGLFPKMETVLAELKAHSLQNRTVALMQNGTWAPMAGKHMKEIFEGMKNINLLEESVTVKSAVKAEQDGQLEALADKIVDSMK